MTDVANVIVHDLPNHACGYIVVRVINHKLFYNECFGNNINKALQYVQKYDDAIIVDYEGGQII